MTDYENVLNGTLDDLKAEDQRLCEVTKNDTISFADVLHGANAYLFRAMWMLSTGNPKHEEKLITYAEALRDFGIFCSCQLNDKEDDLIEVRVGTSRWTMILRKDKEDTWVRSIFETTRTEYSAFDRMISMATFNRHDESGRDHLTFTALMLDE